MRAAGVHQGLAPVMDVTLDYRWGRTDVELRFGRSSQDIAATVPLRLAGAVREDGVERQLLPKVQIDAISLSASGVPGRSK